MICPIVIATVNGNGLAVLLESIRQYSPESPVYLRGPQAVIEQYDADLKIYGQPRNFGDDYNEVIEAALKDWSNVVVANDDIVLTPSSMRLLMEDVDVVTKMDGVRVGWVASRTDAARPSQNVRINDKNESLHFYKYPAENYIKMADEVSPIFAWISGDAFGEAKFPPLNWYSDDVHCLDLARAGFEHYVSVSYVHHVGSQTVGNDIDKLNAQARPWIEANRPEYARDWFET